MVPPVSFAFKDAMASLLMKSQTARLCNASVFNSPTLPVCVCLECVAQFVSTCTWTMLFVVSCGVVLVGIYVSALINQALLGCRQAAG